MDKKNLINLFVRVIMCALISLPVYIIFMLVTIPSVLGLGESRVVAVVIVARIAEEVLYRTVKKSVLTEEREKIEVKA